MLAARSRLLNVEEAGEVGEVGDDSSNRGGSGKAPWGGGWAGGIKELLDWRRIVSFCGENEDRCDEETGEGSSTPNESDEGDAKG